MAFHITVIILAFDLAGDRLSIAFLYVRPVIDRDQLILIRDDLFHHLKHNVMDRFSGKLNLAVMQADNISLFYRDSVIYTVPDRISDHSGLHMLCCFIHPLHVVIRAQFILERDCRCDTHCDILCGNHPDILF